MQRSGTLGAILVEAGTPRLQPRGTALRAAFRAHRAEAYCGSAGATTALAGAALASLPLAVVVVSKPDRALPLGVLAALAVAAPLAAAVSRCTKPARLLAGIVIASGSSALFLAISLDIGSALGLGLLLGSLLLLGAAAGACLDRWGAPLLALAVVGTTVVPFALTLPDAPSTALEVAAQLFSLSPIAAATPHLRFDLLRLPPLYEISVLGSALPLGYPSLATVTLSALLLSAALFGMASRGARRRGAGAAAGSP